MAELLKPAGYSSAIVGKWHLGVGANNTYLPTNQGFDYYLVQATYISTAVCCILLLFRNRVFRIRMTFVPASPALLLTSLASIDVELVRIILSVKNGTRVL